MEPEQEAREAAAIEPMIGVSLGLYAEIPDHLPPLTLPGTSIKLRRWPLVYVTPRVRFYTSIWQHMRAGRPPLTTGTLAWPARLVATLAALDAWPPRGST